VLIEQALQSKLAGTAAISALVGDRIYYVKAPQDAIKPYICIQKISQVRESITTGKRYVEARFQITSFVESYSTLKSIGAAIFTALDKFHGTMGGVGGLHINNCTYDNETDLGFEEPLGLFGLAVDYILLYELTITNT
jgi:hypothetical protein